MIGRTNKEWSLLKLSKNVQKLFLDSFRLMTLKIAINMLDFGEKSIKFE